jgi:hypothetical protein
LLARFLNRLEEIYRFYKNPIVNEGCEQLFKV